MYPPIAGVIDVFEYLHYHSKRWSANRSCTYLIKNTVLFATRGGLDTLSLSLIAKARWARCHRGKSCIQRGQSKKEKKKKEESGWGDVGSRVGSLMSGRWQIPKFLPCAYRTETTRGEQCGFMWTLQLKGPALIRMLAEYKNCPLKSMGPGSSSQIIFCNVAQEQSRPSSQSTPFCHVEQRPLKCTPSKTWKTMRLKTENKQLMPALA